MRPQASAGKRSVRAGDRVSRLYGVAATHPGEGPRRFTGGRRRKQDRDARPGLHAPETAHQPGGGSSRWNLEGRGCRSIERIYKGLGIGYNIADGLAERPYDLAGYGREILADIRAFRGTFYNPRIVEDLSRAIAPPYDIIDDNRKQALRSRSPYNIVRLILPRCGGEREFWNTSARLFRVWKKGEVLAADDEPCLYIYRQAFDLPGEGVASRTGVLALLRCREFSSGEILPHEKTFPRIREERLHLLRACRANFCQIFTVFRDEEEEVLELLVEATTTPPFLELRDDEGVSHQLWRLPEGEDAQGLAGVLGERRLMIADGHHRYETALKYSREEPDAADAWNPGAYVSAVLFRSEDPGLAVLPVHRLLCGLPMPVDEAYRRMEDYFRVEVIQRDIAARKGMFKERLETAARPSFVMVTKEGASLLVLREGVEPETVLGGPGSKRWKNLDMPILHGLAIGEGLGLDATELAEKGRLTFTPWESEAVSAVGEGEAQAAFLVRPTSMDEIWEIAEGGERMPHKSSYFYPKLPSGLVIYDHETAFSPS